ncbi:uncharacterized protein LOC100901396, partial [Galendromus occidentalis]|uniref:Uncharacterized protein LOC100901396 n=1 Tax=Galendromus occidentalis TaxID=34638 RepID=A0AAJ6QST3_9ACAR
CRAECYFPIDIQGTYLLQQSNGQNGITYSEVVIDSDSIPPWGHCHKRRGVPGVILRDPTGVMDCMRCLHLSVKSDNVIHIQAEGLGKCYITEEAARENCPDGNSKHNYELFILYRKEPAKGVFCPFTGRFRVNSYQKDGQESRCLAPRAQFSEVSNCPRGDHFSVKFRSCSFPDRSEKFMCLGDWDSNNSEDRYVALMDTSHDDPKRPKYRCGMYRQDSATGRVYMSLTSDSTCNVLSAHNGYETFMLSPMDQEPLPSIVERAQCVFPEYAQGPWGDQVNIDEGTMVLRDSKNGFSTQTIRCVLQGSDRYPVHMISQCGDETYACVKFQRRSATVIEFQFGTSESAPVKNLCSDERFASSEWITQGRNPAMQQSQSGGCPIVGDYTGSIPGAIGLCARIASDCNNPDIMFYTVYNCENSTHIYEEREYNCLGNWDEDGITYSFTHRRDVHEFQCFSGKIIRGGEEAYIREAGESCSRGEDPFIFGMRVTRYSTCSNILSHLGPALQPASKPNSPRNRLQKPAFHQPSTEKPFHDSTDPYWYRPVSTKPWKRIETHPIDSDHVNEIPSAAGQLVRLNSCLLMLTAVIVSKRFL